jgi:hypothetical protein
MLSFTRRRTRFNAPVRVASRATAFFFFSFPLPRNCCFSFVFRGCFILWVVFLLLSGFVGGLFGFLVGFEGLFGWGAFGKLWMFLVGKFGCSLRVIGLGGLWVLLVGFRIVFVF